MLSMKKVTKVFLRHIYSFQATSKYKYGTKEMTQLQLVTNSSSIIKQRQREILPGYPTFSWNPIKVQYLENVLLLCCSNPM